jgi:peptidoglycan/xylan/chitin deacetylase (PgdA/CDA1 family)
MWRRTIKKFDMKDGQTKAYWREPVDESAMSVRNALTVDVEDYSHVAALAPSTHRDSWTSRESRVVGNTQKLLAIFEQFDVRGKFFVLGSVAEK